MIIKTEIEQNLNLIEAKFSAAADVEALLYAKMALLELCGWIEISMDDLVRRCANHTLKTDRYKNFIEDPIIKNNYGFEYKKHFRFMICNIVGLMNFEKIERNFDDAKLARFKGALGGLKLPRDSEAHTFVVANRSIDTPTRTINNLGFLYDGFIELESVLKRLGFLP